MSNNLNLILEESRNLASLAINYDRQKDIEAAIYFYQECVKTLKKYLDINQNNSDVEAKLDEYSKRLHQLQEKYYQSKNQIKNQVEKVESHSGVERLEFLLNEALNEDEDDNPEDALPLYLEAVETGLEIKKGIDDEKLNSRLTFIITKALERAEAIKGIDHIKSNEKSTDLTNQFKNSLSFRDESLNIQNIPTASGHIVTGQETYTKDEIKVLKKSSNINGIDYLPFIAAIDLRERFSTLLPFSDPKGLLTLSSKQRASLVEFRRLSEISENPCIFSNIQQIDCFAVKQTVVTDCSFIASLTVAALYERRFSQRLISRIIYPQNRHREPVYNPCGKYIIQLNLNGILRKVIIDDRLPVGHYGQLLCSYSTNKNEFWISLLEKAYMKVMGGYDFPGSNSNIDLHALTGWIPERICLKEWNSEKLFKLIINRYNQGDVLVTFSTGEMPDSESERTGLVPTHAYAMLDVKNIHGKKLFLLKNPWSHVRWKGNYSERDLSSWTSDLRKALNYDPNNAKNFDNGVFWIDIDSLFHFYDVCYFSWNPSLFKFSYCTHDFWNAGVGPAKDLFYIGDNPQYSLTVKSPGSSIWVLLTRHIMDRDDFANNKEYIALLVYKNNGEKVYTPFEPKPYIDGARINSPHYLCKLIIDEKNPTLRYTLVISQYEKSTTILYSLRAYSTSAFSLKKIPNIYKYKEVDKNGQWTRETAGGCRNHPESYHLNPVFQLVINGSSRDEDNELMIELRGPKAYAVGIELSSVSLINPNSPNYFSRKDSGAFRSGFTFLKAKSIPTGTYQICVSTYLPGQKGPFFLTVHSTHSIKLSRLK